MSPNDYGNLSNQQKAELESEDFKFTDLKERLGKLNKKTIECHKSGEDRNVADLLGEIYIEDKSRGERNMSGNTFNFNAPTQFNNEFIAVFSCV
ncbi:MAG TPA: hypothetical protein VGC97_02210 [Pyrinomonadaceae bacterium]|jgi:hypothetical protein